MDNSISFRKKLYAAAFAAGATVLIYVFQSTLDFWETTDDLFISNVLNGVYSSRDNYCMFVNPILAWLVSLIGRVLPTVDGFALLRGVLVLTGLWCVMYILALSVRGLTVSALLLTLLAVNGKINLLHLPFTGLTALLSLFGFVITYSSARKGLNRALAAVGLLMLFFSMILRKDAFLFVIPYVLLVLFTDLISSDEKKACVKRYALYLLPLAVLFVLCSTVKDINDRSEKYAEGCGYNYARSDIVDYPQRDYAGCAESFAELGVSENDFEALKALIIADTDTVTREYLEAVSEISALSFDERLDAFLENGAEEFFTKTWSYEELRIQLIMLAGILVLLLFSKTEIRFRLEAVLALLGALFICLALKLKGRSVNYVTQAVLLNVWALLLIRLICGDYRFRHGRAAGAAVSLCAAVMFVLSGPKYSFGNSFAPFRAYEAPFTDILQYDDSEDTVYIWGIYTFTRAMYDAGFSRFGRLLPEELITHNIVDGDWCYAQPYYSDLLERAGIDNPMKALLCREHTYYAADEERCAAVLTYLREHYDEDARVENVARIYNIPVWRFSAD